MKKLIRGSSALIIVTLLSTTAVMAKQNNYTSQGDRLKQELRDSTRVHPKRDMQTKPHDSYQGLKNNLYGGSDTKGYKLDAYGNDVPLN